MHHMHPKGAVLISFFCGERRWPVYFDPKLFLFMYEKEVKLQRQILEKEIIFNSLNDHVYPFLLLSKGYCYIARGISPSVCLGRYFLCVQASIL